MLLYLIGIILFLCILHILLNYNERARMIRKIPGPKMDFIFGNGLTIIESTSGIMTMGRKFAKQWDGIYSLWIYPYGAVVIYNPEDVERAVIRLYNMLLYLIGIILFLCILHILLNYNERARMIRKIPGPKMDFIVGNGLTIIESTSGIMTMCRKFAKQWDGIYSLWIYPFGAVVIYNPEDVEIIMSSTKYADKSIIYTFLKPWLREGLLVSNGTKWQERRKILTPAFHFNILKQFNDIIDENSKMLVENLKATAGKPIDVLPVLSEFTLNSICETAMGTRLNEDTTGAAKSYKDALYRVGFIFFQRFVRVYLYPEFLFNMTSWGRKQRHYLKIIHSFTESVIESRKKYVKDNGINLDTLIDDDTYVYKKKKRTAMLDLLISAEKDGLIDKTGIQEEVDTFMFEGHDTTASGLSFCLMLLANHKHVQDKIREELYEIFGDTKRPITMDDLNKMKYLECCIKESMRMYPPVHFISRNINETTVLSNYTLPAGTHCHIPILDLHYRENVYKNPKQFDPDRFRPENSVGRHPYAYIPFSAGARNCIGQRFAMMEMKIAITKVIQEFDLTPVTRPEDIRFNADLVLRNNGPILVNFIKRE